MNFSETMQPSEENDQEEPFQVLIQFTHGLLTWYGWEGGCSKIYDPGSLKASLGPED